MRRLSFWGILLLLAVALSGCAPAETRARVRYVWPPEGDDPKIEYLGFYSSQANFKTTVFANISDVVLGVEPARPDFSFPSAVDAFGSIVLVTDSALRAVFAIDLDRKTFERIDMEVGFPAGVALFDEREFLLVDSQAKTVGHYTLAGQLLAIFGSDKLIRPTSVAIDRRHQRIAVADPSKHRLAIFSAKGLFLGYLGERGTSPGQFNYPLDADFDTDGNLYVLDSMNFRVQRFAWNGSGYDYVSQFGQVGTETGAFARPKSLAVTPSNHVYVTDAMAHQVIIFDRDGTYLMTYGGKYLVSDGYFAPGGMYMPSGIAADDHDGLWVVDTLNRMVHHLQYLNEKYLRANPILPGQIAPVAGGGSGSKQ